MELSVEVVPFPVPGTVSLRVPQRAQSGSRQMLASPQIPLTELTPAQLDAMCREFREAVFRAAGKEPPQTARCDECGAFAVKVSVDAAGVTHGFCQQHADEMAGALAELRHAAEGSDIVTGCNLVAGEGGASCVGSLQTPEPSAKGTAVEDPIGEAWHWMRREDLRITLLPAVDGSVLIDCERRRQGAWATVNRWVSSAGQSLTNAITQAIASVFADNAY